LKSDGLRKQGQACRRPAHSTGFTLVEILVCLAVLSLVLLAVYRLHAQSIAATRTARFQAVAPLLARQQLAEWERFDRPVPFSDTGDFGEAHPGYAWEVSVAGTYSERLGEVGADLRRIDLTISFNEDEFRYRLRTYRFARQ
jgi:general secretion pathway protein I